MSSFQQEHYLLSSFAHLVSDTDLSWRKFITSWGGFHRMMPREVSSSFLGMELSREEWHWVWEARWEFCQHSLKNRDHFPFIHAHHKPSE